VVQCGDTKERMRKGQGEKGRGKWKERKHLREIRRGRSFNREKKDKLRETGGKETELEAKKNRAVISPSSHPLMV